jgi:hypothetical protein
MADVKFSAAAARHAAHVLGQIWMEQGQQPEDYDVVRRAQNYLLKCSEQMP